MEELTIRKGTLKDVNKVYSLGSKTKELKFSEHMKFHEKGEIRGWTKGKENIFLIAQKEDSKELLGFLYAKIISKDWCIFDNLVIKKEYRKEGIGTLLYDELDNILKKNKISYIQGLVQSSKKSTLGFWKSKGFKEGKKFTWIGKEIR